MKLKKFFLILLIIVLLAVLASSCSSKSSSEAVNNTNSNTQVNSSKASACLTPSQQSNVTPKEKANYTILLDGTPQESGSITIYNTNINITENSNLRDIVNSIAKSFKNSTVWDVQGTDDKDVMLIEKSPGSSQMPANPISVKGLKIHGVYAGGKCCAPGTSCSTDSK